MDIAGKLKQINARLRTSHVGVAVDRRGDRLRLRATLPPKPGSGKTTPYQQRLALGLSVNPAGLKEAEKRARLLGAQLAAREFNWSDWGFQEAIERRCCGEWIDLYKAHYLGQGGTVTTWDGDYAKPLGKLPAQATLSVELLETLVRATRANTRSRQRAAMVRG